jgi:hypothetical protein
MSQVQHYRRLAFGGLQALAALMVFAPPAMAASIGRQSLLPTTFIGEAATLALAFAAPALCAGGYLLMKQLANRTSTPFAIGLGVLTTVGGAAIAVGGQNGLFAHLLGS